MTGKAAAGMRIAFHAPMKPPDDPLPSGDRQVARLLVAALQRGGHDVAVASRLVTWRPRPDGEEDARLAAAADAEARRILADVAAGGARPALWLTYHLYHKAPDLLGPRVAGALAIPYVVVEASRAAKRARDPWAARLALVDAALAAADAVVAVHADDAEGLAAVVPPGRLHLAPPFLDAAPFVEAGRRRVAAAAPRLLAVAMMRRGDKARSYAILAEALGRLTDRAWTLDIVGDGPARAEVAAAFADAGLAGRVALRGVARPAEMPAVYAAADLLVWPAVNEAYGMVFLEAQAAGLPVVGASRPGVAAIVRDGKTGRLVAEGDVAAFAAAVAALLDDPDRRAAMGRAAAAHVARDHDIRAGARRLEAILAAAVAHHAASRCVP